MRDTCWAPCILCLMKVCLLCEQGLLLVWPFKTIAMLAGFLNPPAFIIAVLPQVLYLSIYLRPQLEARRTTARGAAAASEATRAASSEACVQVRGTAVQSVQFSAQIVWALCSVYTAQYVQIVASSSASCIAPDSH